MDSTIINIFIWTVSISSLIAAITPAQKSPRKQRILDVIHVLSLNIGHAKKRLMSSLDRQLVSEREDTFTKIYLGNMWQSQESKSGTGSELASTENIVKKLPDLISELNIKSVFDAGCGDWNWFKEIDINFNYLGGDIVKPLIEELQKKARKEKH